MASNQQSSRVKPNIMVGFIGGGRMAQALAKGFISSGLVRANNIIISDTDTSVLSYLKTLGVKTTDSNIDVVVDSDVVIIAVKPHVVRPVLEEVSSVVAVEKQLFVSIAGGVTIGSIEQTLPTGTRVVRVMPNTPALVQAGAAVFACGSSANGQDGDVVQNLFGTVGICEKGSESILDAVTGLSGSGPAYAFVAIEALSDGGVKMGLPRALATRLAAQTMMGAAKMVLDTGKHPGVLKDDVCSPGGTTITAMHSLEKNGFRGALIDAVEAAALRAKELGANN